MVKYYRMSTSPSASQTSLNIELALNSVFASKKKSLGKEQGVQDHAQTLTPGNFQVSATLDEESRRDSQLNLSFTLTLNDSRGLVTYEFRGTCTVNGSTAEFTSLLEAEKNKVPKILDVIYQRLYPVVFMLAGATFASYPQSVALGAQMLSTAGQMSNLEEKSAEERVISAMKAAGEKKPSTIVPKKADEKAGEPIPAAAPTIKRVATPDSSGPTIQTLGNTAKNGPYVRPASSPAGNVKADVPTAVQTPQNANKDKSVSSGAVTA